MKQLVLNIVLLLPLWAGAQGMNYTIKGSILHHRPKVKIYLRQYLAEKTFLDSATISNGKFSFTGALDKVIRGELILSDTTPAINGPSLDKKPIFLEQGTITVKIKDSLSNAEIKGQAVNTDFQRYTSMTSPLLEKIERLTSAYRQLTAEQKKDSTIGGPFLDSFRAAYSQLNNLKQDFIKKNPGSYISVFVLNELLYVYLNNNIRKIDTLYGTLSSTIRHSSNGRSLQKLIAYYMSTAPGSIAPDFIQNDPDGKPVKLSDFKGKYVLLDFWASWCGPCRAENPNVVKAYQKYKDKNFTIIGISLDKPGKKEDWLKAIATDSLTWTQVSDLKFWQNEVAQLYSIAAIPQNFLLDPHGQIIAVNLRGEALDHTLSQLLEK